MKILESCLHETRFQQEITITKPEYFAINTQRILAQFQRSMNGYRNAQSKLFAQLTWGMQVRYCVVDHLTNLLTWISES